MHLKFGYFVLSTPIYRLTERKKRFHGQNWPCGMVGAKIGYVLGLLVHGIKVVVKFGRKVFLVHNRKCHIFMQINIREFTHVSHQMYAAILQQYFHRHILSMCTRYLNCCRCDVESIETKLNTTLFDFAAFVLRVFIWSYFNEVLFYILGINCIKLIFGYLYFSPNTFPKI